MKAFFYWIGRVLASALFLAAFASVAVAFVAMAVWLIIAPIVPPEAADIWEDLRCSWGYPSQTDGTACMQQKIADVTARAKAEQERLKAKAEQERLKAEAEQARLKAKAKKELAAAKRAREAAEKALSDQNMVFYEGKAPDGTTLVAGVVFKGKDASTGIARGFCWSTQDKPGYDYRLLISKINAAGQVELVQANPPKEFTRTWNGSELAAAQLACPWPQATKS
ncbi:MAG: hypothetical protein AAFR90_12895 [Pseudomonadota bacterium]